MTAYKGNKRN